jgi:cystathionine beta-lyase/cystathionine gamma-synthase
MIPETLPVINGYHAEDNEHQLIKPPNQSVSSSVTMISEALPVINGLHARDKDQICSSLSSMHDVWRMLLSRFKHNTNALKNRFDKYKALCKELGLQRDEWCESIFLNDYEKLLKLTTTFEMALMPSNGGGPPTNGWERGLELWQIEERYRALAQLQSTLWSFFERACPAYDGSKMSWFFDPSYYQSQDVNYDRFASPNVRDLEQRLLDTLQLGSNQNPKLLLMSSGMASFTVIQQYIVQQLGHGGVVAVSPYIYFESFHPIRSQKSLTFVNADRFDPESLIETAEKHNARAVFLDPMSNTVGLDTIDVRRFARLVANREGWEDRLVVIDGTLVSGGMQLYDWFDGPHCPKVLYYESAHKYIQLGLDLIMCGYVVMPEILVPAIQLIRQTTGTVLYSRNAFLLPPIDKTVFQFRMSRLTENAEKLHQLLEAGSRAIAEVTFPHHWREYGWRHGGNVVTVRFHGHGLNKKPNLTRCCDEILRAAEEEGVHMIKGASLGFSTTRIFEADAFFEDTDPFLRISVGVESEHIESVARAILNGMRRYCVSAMPVNLDVGKQLYDASFYNAMTSLLEMRTRYTKERVVFMEGEWLIPILKALGAQAEDFDALQQVSNHLGNDPTVNYRTIRNGLFCFDFENKTIRRLRKQRFTLTVEEDYKRHDSGLARDFPEVRGDLQYNTVLQALMVVKAFIMNKVDIKPRAHLDYTSPYSLCNVFNIRTFTEKDILGEPTLEGVHTDGSDHTMTTFLGATNLRQDSAVTFIHDLKEITGTAASEAHPGLITHRFQHRHFLDSLLFADNESKHSLTSVFQADLSKRATRDMLLFLTRKPKLSGHPSRSVDIMENHKTLPMNVPLWL